MSEREQLFTQIQQHEFALIDASLFLDTNPNDAAALAYFNEIQAAYWTAVTDYQARFGPLTAKGGNYTDSWTWVNDPWPWEGVID